MGPRGFSIKNIYWAYYNCYHFAIYRGGTWKLPISWAKHYVYMIVRYSLTHKGGWGVKSSGWGWKGQGWVDKKRKCYITSSLISHQSLAVCACMRVCMWSWIILLTGLENLQWAELCYSLDSASNCSNLVSMSFSISSVSRALRSSVTSVKSATDLPSNSNALTLLASLSLSLLSL